MGSSPEEYTEIRRELVAQYAAWRESAPDNPVLPYIQAKLTDDKKKSAELFRLATRIDSGFAAAWYELGVASEYFADFDGAVQHFRRAAAADPSMIEALRRIAYLRRHGDWRVYREDTEAVVAALVARSESGDSASAAALISRHWHQRQRRGSNSTGAPSSSSRPIRMPIEVSTSSCATMTLVLPPPSYVKSSRKVVAVYRLTVGSITIAAICSSNWGVRYVWPVSRRSRSDI